MENDKVQIIPLTVGYNDLEAVGAVTILDPRVEELLVYQRATLHEVDQIVNSLLSF